jgi:hypothetical protein
MGQGINWQMVTAITAIVSLVFGIGGSILALLFKHAERSILDRIEAIGESVKDLQNHRDRDKERMHKLEIAFANIGTELANFRAKMAELYVSRGEWNRFRDEMQTSLSRIQTFCLKKHGAFPAPGDSGPNPTS